MGTLYYLKGWWNGSLSNRSAMQDWLPEADPQNPGGAFQS